MMNKHLAILVMIAFAIVVLGALAVIFYPFLGHCWDKAILASLLLVTGVYGLRRAF